MSEVPADQHADTRDDDPTDPDHLDDCFDSFVWSRNGQIVTMPRPSKRWSCPACARFRLSQLLEQIDEVSVAAYLFVAQVERDYLPAIRQRAGRLKAGRLSVRRGPDVPMFFVADIDLAPRSRTFLPLPRPDALDELRVVIDAGQIERVEFLGPWRRPKGSQPSSGLVFLGSAASTAVDRVLADLGVRRGSQVDVETEAELAARLKAAYSDRYGVTWASPRDNTRNVT